MLKFLFDFEKKKKKKRNESILMNRDVQCTYLLRIIQQILTTTATRWLVHTILCIHHAVDKSQQPVSHHTIQGCRKCGMINILQSFYHIKTTWVVNLKWFICCCWCINANFIIFIVLPSLSRNEIRQSTRLWIVV